LQLQFPFLHPAPPEPPIEFVRMRRAKRYILRVRRDGSLRVTVPRGGSRAEARQFVERHLHWILQERLRVAERYGPAEWGHGSTILLEGSPATIHVEPARTAPVHMVTYGERRFAVPATATDLRPYVETDLRALARETLPARLHELAAVHGLCVARVTIRNQRSRWGSCSRNGSIALNFRLVQMPPSIRDYVLVHELMHLKQQNHGPRFWKLVAAAFPGYRAAEQWLSTEGRRLF
jgi:predicted metal-dependent hydrolase